VLDARDVGPAGPGEALTAAVAVEQVEEEWQERPDAALLERKSAPAQHNKTDEPNLTARHQGLTLIAQRGAMQQGGE
jgi:hypothetical protein